MAIEAVRVGNMVSLHVGNAPGTVSKREQNVKIAELNCVPAVDMRSLLGTGDSNGWLLLVVAAGDPGVYINQRFGPESVTWGIIDGGLCFAVR